MARIAPPLFGSDWTEDQVERFEEIKSEILFPSVYAATEATLAFLTFRILNMMIPGERPADRPALIRIQETAVEIVCRRLLGEQYRSGPPSLHKWENALPEPMDPNREQLIDAVKYWFDHERKSTTGDINPDQFRRLEDALNIAQSDGEAIKLARRSRQRKVPESGR